MEAFAEYLDRLDKPEQRDGMEEVLGWVLKKYPRLEPKIAWKQPMFTDHGTFIIGFSASRNHFSVSPELAGMIRLADDIAKSGYEYTKQLVRIPWKGSVDYSLLEKMIEFNIEDKADHTNFWRKE